jgi:N-acetylneuraminic acid mutarotase
VSDNEIIDLDEPEPVARPEPWRAGSLTLAVAPVAVVVVALVIALAVPRPVDTTASGPVATPASIGESGDAEVLETQHWATVGPSYPARGDVAEAVLNGYAYVIAGTGTPDDGRQVYRYDLHTGERQRVADLPISLDHAMAATLEDRIYVFGGYAFGQPTARVFSLGANDARWIEHSPMPGARAAGGAAVLGDHIFIVGGVGANGDWIRDFWAYDAAGRWSTDLDPLPTPRDHLAVGTYRGWVCAAGGNGATQKFECFDPARNQWSWMPDLRKPVIGGRAVESAGWFWVVAGDVQIFTFDHWHFGPRLNAPRAGHALVHVDGTLYVIEGGRGPANGRMETLRPQP